MGLARIELATSRLSGVRSNQLSYRPVFVPVKNQGREGTGPTGPAYRPRRTGNGAQCGVPSRHPTGFETGTTRPQTSRWQSGSAAPLAQLFGSRRTTAVSL
jgi:hypothetical protein